MSGADAACGCRLLDWDSQFFSRRIATLNVEPDATPDAEAIDAWCRQNVVDCLYYLAPASRPEPIAFAGQNGFRLLDIRLTLACRFAAPPPASPAATALLRIARASHRNTRFFRDGNFPVELCEKLYERWIENSLADPEAFVCVADIAGQAVGYCTGQRCADGTGQIGLLAVDAAQRRLGLGRQLVRRMLAWFREQQLTGAHVVTQGGCVGPQQLYQQCGFVTSAVELWYHKWFTAAGR